MHAQIPLINVTELSEQLCKQPVQNYLVYATRDNFLGRIVAGYHPSATKLCLMTQNSAKALCDAQKQLNEKNLGLFVFDAYRPLRATRDFMHWTQQPVAHDYELERKKIHYPHLEKDQLVHLGYLADGVSNHCFGDTVDLVLIDLKNNTLLNMGTCFDYFDEISHTTATAEHIGEEAYQNRQILSDAMLNVGFTPYEKEFWHFTFHQRDIDSPLDIEINS